MPLKSKNINTKLAPSPDNLPPQEAELLGISLTLQPLSQSNLYAHYPVGLHAWFLDQVRKQDPILSAQMHDEQTQKNFTLSRLESCLELKGRSQHLSPNQTYQWTITGLTQPVVQWLHNWTIALPTTLDFNQAPFKIQRWQIEHPPTTYRQLLETAQQKLVQAHHQPIKQTLNFTSPTSFRHKKQHLPLPIPTNIFQSYLRRWNCFSQNPIEPEPFLAWVDESITLTQHNIQTIKTLGGKSGSVIGFIGSVQFSIPTNPTQNLEYSELAIALLQLAPYSGTGHKTPFGLGQTVLSNQINSLKKTSLSKRITKLTEHFIAQRKRTGGTRAQNISQTWATILARQETGESLIAIASDLEMPYETVKTYAKRAQQSIRDESALA
jgi:CRISPR-associated endoribonuclease Cas6